VVKIKTEKVAKKLSDIFADNRLTLSDWKYMIPFYLLKEQMQIVTVAKNFADGINYQIDRHGLDIPAEFIVAYPEDNMVVLNGKEFRGLKN
jgi:hypothetical protein